MIFLGLRNWAFTDEKTGEYKEGTSIHLGKEIDPKNGLGYEAIKKGFSRGFDFKALEGIKPLDKVKVFFDEFGRVTYISK